MLSFVLSIKFMSDLSYKTKLKPLYEKMNLLNVNGVCKKLSNNLLPQYFSKLFHQSSSLHCYFTRSVHKSNSYYIHGTNLVKTDQSIKIIGPKIRNNVPTHLKDKVMKKSFLKTS